MDCMMLLTDTTLPISKTGKLKQSLIFQTAVKFPPRKSLIIIRGPKYPLVFAYYTHGISPTIMRVTPNGEYFIFSINTSDQNYNLHITKPVLPSCVRQGLRAELVL